MTRHDRQPDTWNGQSYYDQPPLKNPHWDWKVSGYIAVAAVSGAAQALSWIGSLRDRAAFQGARRNASAIGLIGSVMGAALLIADLKTPQRFHNMLRILRPTSPMSFGTYIFGLFGTSSALASLGELPAVSRYRPLRWITRLAHGGAAISGAGVATYTAALMSATSNPYWSSAPRALGAQFATSAIASGAAALALLERFSGRTRTARQLEGVAALASAAHAGATLCAKQRHQEVGLDEALSDHPGRRLDAADLLVAGALPLAAYAVDRATGGRSPTAAVVGSAAVLAGGWLMRHGILNTGKETARRPAAAFRVASPCNLPRTDKRRSWIRN